MTLQRQDYLFADGERRRIAAAAPIPFVPIEHSLHFPGMLATNCDRGFWIDLELVEGLLTIKELHLAIHPDDMRGLVEGQLFGREPNKTSEFTATYEAVPLDYSGSLIVNLMEFHTAPSTALTHERFDFEKGRLIHRTEQRLSELPDGFTPSSVWLDYGVMLWIFPEGSEEKGEV